MKPPVSIPASTRRELANPASPGHRHEQAKKIACALIGQGLASEAVFCQLQAMRYQGMSNSELQGIVRWAANNIAPRAPPPRLSSSPFKKNVLATPSNPIEEVRRFLKPLPLCDATTEDLEYELWEASTWRPQEDWRMDALMFMAGCYHAGELINVVTEHSIETDRAGKDKANPTGYGKTLERDAWMRRIRERGVPQGDGGTWIRMNPVDGEGIADANVTAFRFALVELDAVPLELQLGLLAKLKLPITAITTSGGRSAHALLKIDAKTESEYRATSGKVLALLAPFGVCQANKNPSRMSRLPGVQRTLGAQGDGRQRLLFFNPDAKEWRSTL